MRTEAIDYAADCLIKRPSPKERFLGNIVKVSNGLGIVAWQDPASNFPSALVDDNPMSVDHVDFWMLSEKPAHKTKCSWQEQVVGIQIGHDFAVEVAEALRNSMGLAFVSSLT